MPESKSTTRPRFTAVSADSVADASSAGNASQDGVLVVGYREGQDLPPSLKRINDLAGGWVDRLVDAGQLSGKGGETLLLAAPPEVEYLMVLVVGLSKDSPERCGAYEAAATAVRMLCDRPRSIVVIALAESFPEAMHDSIVAGAVSACEGQALYRAEPPIHLSAEIAFIGVAETSLDRGQVIGDSVNHTKRLVNEPPSVVFPSSFVDMAQQILEGTSVTIEVWDEQRLQKEDCRAILAVGRGSSQPPRLLIMRYTPEPEGEPLAIVGKGVTFDSGGLSLKPSDAMADMKCDMAGAATVVGTMHAISKLGVKKNVIGFCGLAENMVSGDSYKLGDVIETRSGKTIEILNTDAEGRVVLADTLDVAIQNRPRAMVDLATLTGACLVALGTDVTGLMTNNEGLCRRIEESASREGEPVWELPMFELYDDKIKSKVADIKNIGEGRWGGAITAAKFLENFVGDVPWVHMDIAGPAFSDSPRPYRDAGATGSMVRTLVDWIEAEPG